VLRDALLDHIAIAVESGHTRIEIRQGLVQAVLRMGFVTTDVTGEVTVRTARHWAGLATRYGEVWQQTGASLAIRIVR
jgi:hypothetical protein